MPSPPNAIPLSGLILLRAVQRLDALTPLDDVQALRQAHAAERTPVGRLVMRARLLAREQGLDRELQAWRGRMVVVAMLAALAVGLLSYGLVKAVVGDDRQINAVAALLAVLGPHLLSLALWLLLLGTGGSGAGLAGWGARLAARLGDGTAHSRLLLEAGFDVLARKPGLSAWAFGIVNHAIWSLALLLTLVGLMLAFSFLAYRLSWETTILDAGFFSTVSRVSGWLPAQLLGIAIPDAAAGKDRDWALWLLGCTLFYGLGLRLIALGVSAWRTRRLLRSLRVDTTDPQLRQLLARFAALDASELLDLEHKALPAAMPAKPMANMQGTALIGYELPPAAPWPPVGIEAELQTTIAGAAEEKRAVLARLQAAAPQRLLIVCHAPASPDRGTARFLREAAQTAGATALLLTGGSARWADWLAAGQLPLAAVFESPAEAAQWLGLA